MTLSTRARRAALLTPLALLAAPAPAMACACGCGIFDVGDGTLMADADSGLTIWARYAHMVQDQLREGDHRANPADNGDKRIATDFYTIGADYRINARWQVKLELPLVQRAFTTTDDGTYAAAEGTVNTRRLTDLGDMTLRATYTGLFANGATGLTLGLKLPTGRASSPAGPLGGAGFDRDTLPGTGSTDLILGAHHVGMITPRLSYFVQGQYQFAMSTRDGYRPGNEADATVGLTYDTSASPDGFGILPGIQLIGATRAHDTGDNADPLNTGYRRLLIAPGVKWRLSHRASLFTDVAFPIAQHVNAGDPALGDSGQLVAPAQLRVQFTYKI
ncbi:MAG TPA: hypothetical protein VFF98_14690 [Novosphingobium sp.]|nr:hypothetical protein [Novosphingobium sp.]